MSLKLFDFLFGSFQNLTYSRVTIIRAVKGRQLYKFPTFKDSMEIKSIFTESAMQAATIIPNNGSDMEAGERARKARNGEIYDNPFWDSYSEYQASVDKIWATDLRGSYPEQAG